MRIICERCGKEEEVDFPENLFDFRYKYGFEFCEACVLAWLHPDNDLRKMPDKWTMRQEAML